MQYYLPFRREHEAQGDNIAYRIHLNLVELKPLKDDQLILRCELQLRQI